MDNNLEIKMIAMMKVGNSYVVAYRDGEGNEIMAGQITAQQIFDFAERKIRKKNDI